jgi:hypothetical protein
MVEMPIKGNNTSLALIRESETETHGLGKYRSDD